ncbi:MAG: CorA family divalent cation transporter [Hyphomonadaceae bacterium]
MLNVYARLAPDAPLMNAPELAPNDERAIWIDLDRPSETEESYVETALGVDVPTHDERAAFEESARFFEEDNHLVMTATLLGRRDEGPFISDAVMFVLAGPKLVTVRLINPRAFTVGQGRATARIEQARTGADVFLALLESVVERIADRLAEATQDASALSAVIFADGGGPPNLRAAMRRLGTIGALAAQTLDSLSSLLRLITFAQAVGARHGLAGARLKALRHDCKELERTGAALQARLAFLLDAAVGMVSVNQNEILKALSIATIAFVPPTLAASIFGMNFTHFTWYAAAWGPWAAFALMLAAPAALFTLAKWRGWF